MRKITLSLATAAVAFIAPAIPAKAHFYAGCKKNKCKRHVIKPHRDRLDRMHNCEARGAGWFKDGLFDGGLQFTPSTWQATGSPVSFAYMASKTEQRYRAVVWASMIGWAWRSTAGWPNCG